MQCKVAFLGAGYMAEEHIKAFGDISGVEIVGIYSRTYLKAEKLSIKHNFSGKSYTSIEELYTKSKADLVVISVPELEVNQVCMEVFKYPWTCLVEKPAGYNYEDALSIANAADFNNRKVFVALNRRLYSSTRKIVQELSNSSEPRLIHVFDQENPTYALSVGQPELVVKNWMYANSVHMIDYLILFGRGNIVSVDPVIKWNHDKPNFVLSKITFDSGDIGIYEAVWDAPGPWAVTVTNHEKRWELRPLEQASTQLYGSRKVELLETDDWDKQFKPGIRYQAEEAVKAALDQTTQLATIANAMQTMQLIKRIYS
jgi:predicted dehydrogenase